MYVLIYLFLYYIMIYLFLYYIVLLYQVMQPVFTTSSDSSCSLASSQIRPCPDPRLCTASRPGGVKMTKKKVSVVIRALMNITQVWTVTRESSNPIPVIDLHRDFILQRFWVPKMTVSLSPKLFNTKQSSHESLTLVKVCEVCGQECSGSQIKSFCVGWSWAWGIQY